MMIEHPVWLVALLFAPIAGYLALRARQSRITAANAWSRALGVQAATMGRRSPWLFALVAACIGVGIAGPRWGSSSQNTESRALNIVVVMDVSKSMLAEDAPPNRLGRAVSMARRLVQDLDGDRFALVGFSGHPYLLSPLTLDQSAVTLQLDALDPEMASVGGSGIGAALDLARKVLTASPQGGDRAVVLFTDGETFEGNGSLTSAGAALKRSGITLVAVPVGSVQGARIPDPDQNGWHHDQDGKIVVTARRDDLLQIAVTAANGVLIPADAPDAVGDARRALAHLNRTTTRDRVAADLVPRAWMFAAIAAILLLAQTLTRRSASLIALALAIGAARASAQRPSNGTRLLRQGDTVRARAAFAADLKRSASDTTLFNAGTSALLAGDMPTAIDALQRATLSLDPALRQRALYNLGTAYLMQARRDSVQRDTLLASASSQLQQALLLAPGDRNAKFNYELARRLRPPPPPPSSAPKPKQSPPKPAPGQSPPGQSRNGMTPAEADQVLSAMERAERLTRQNQYQRTRRGEPPLGPDW